MNKTVNINLGGMFFHIDEDAYVKLSRYFEAIKKQLSDSDGKDEIMSDIEIRISELFSEKLKSDKQVISMKDIDEVIAIMGEPQDYRIDNEESTYQSTYSSTKAKKLYRDIDKNVLGGVCRGLAYYLGIDVIWVRIIMIILAFVTQGIGILIYIILWIVIPKAVTTSEKLEMKGEAVNISNIEKKVREEFDNISQKVSDIDYEKFGNKVQDGANKVGNSLSNFILGFVKVIAKIIGFFIIIISVTSLVSLVLAIITIGTTDYVKLPWLGISQAFNYLEFPAWILGLLFLLAIGIPFVALMILGFRILIPNSKSFGKVFNYSLFVVWVISIFALITIGIKQTTEVAFEEKVSETQHIYIQPTDTLHINILGNYRFDKTNKSQNFRLVLDENEKEVMYSNNIKVNIQKTKENQPYVVVNKFAGGNSLINAKKRAEEVKYNFTINGNQLTFDDYLLVDLKSKFRNQSVKMEVFIPENQVFFVEESNNSKYWYEYSIEDDNTIKTNHTYIFEGNSYRCLDCVTEKNEPEQPQIINDTILVYPEKGRLEVGNDGEIVRSRQSQ